MRPMQLKGGKTEAPWGQQVIFVGIYRAMDASRHRSSPCRRRRQELGLNKTPPLDKEDFDVEEGGFYWATECIGIYTQSCSFLSIGEILYF